jgi:CheY-like chemotaxis protein
VVDDDPLVAAVVRRTLSRGYAVVTAPGGAEALEILAADGAFDAIVCDLLMPGVDGAAVHARLAATAPELAARMVFLSGDTFTARARALLATSGRPALPKPFDAQQLRGAVASVIDAAARRSAA